MSRVPEVALADLVSRQRVSPASTKEHWSLNLDQIESHSGRVLSWERVGNDQVAASTFFFDKDTVLYSKLRPYLNKVVVADRQGVATTELVPLRVDPDRVLPSYVAYFLRSPRFLQFATTVVAGAKMPRMVMTEFWKYKIPLPPLPEQRRIAAILDKADALRAQRRQAIAKLDQLLQSVFLEMFGDPVTNPKGWPSDRTLGDVSEIVSGITKGRIAKDATREVPYLAVVNVQDRSLRLDVVKHIEATESEIAKYKLQVNDLLLTEGGDPDKLGRGVLWDGSLEECIHQNHVFRVRLTTGDIHPVYLNWYVGSERGKRYFASQAKQTTGIASINMRQLRALPLLLPPMALQRRFADNVMTTAQHKTRLNRSVSGLDQLLTALQHSAFSAAT